MKKRVLYRFWYNKLAGKYISEKNSNDEHSEKRLHYFNLDYCK